MEKTFLTRHIDYIPSRETSPNRLKVTSFALDEPIYVNKIKLKFGNKGIEIYTGTGTIFTEGSDMLYCKIEEKTVFGKKVKELICTEG